jgi:hypothetical protein
MRGQASRQMLLINRGRSYGELDILFEHRVPAWKFKTTKADRELCSVPLWTYAHTAEFAVINRTEGDEEGGTTGAGDVSHLESRQ